MRSPTSDRPRSSSPSLAATLSFIWPGLGQAYTRHRRSAVVFALPVFLVAGLALYEARRGPAVLVARLLDPTVAAAVFVAVVGLGLWRLAAVIHAYRSARSAGARRTPGRIWLGLLLVIVASSHAIGAAYVFSAYRMDMGIFAVGGNGAEPALNLGQGSRVTVLLAGLDQYSTRSERLYDSLMVVSVDTKSKRIATINVPRDTAGYPLYWGGTGKVKINAIPTYVRNGWLKSPDQPVTTLVKEVGYLVGIPINYYCVVDLGSFMKIVDMVGGVEITNSSAINDPTYDWLDKGPTGFKLSAGAHHLNGRLALAYARSRHGAGNNDYKRAERQQQLLVALARKMGDPAMAGRLPDLMGEAGALIKTNFPASGVADMVDLAQSIPSSSFDKYVLGPPYSVSTTKSGGASTSCLRLDRVAALSVKLFGADSRYYGNPQPASC
jgi:LCP family protein required for cell wall assembly